MLWQINYKGTVVLRHKLKMQLSKYLFGVATTETLKAG